jgi:UDP-GalNAc:undecaprenyl-phosphate GalNAc-1-phosphate transferase
VTGPPVLSAGAERYLAFRRALELGLLVAVAPVALVLSVLVALAIWSEDRGPVFFVQRRQGRGGRPFVLLKFRTMRPAAESAALRLTERYDPRITRVGAVLRRAHLDELPQLLNVACGQMSLIGPRPVPLALYPRYAELIPGYDWRHAVPPGLTGPAQLTLGYTRDVAGERDKWALDCAYISELGWRRDLRVLLATLHLCRLASRTPAPQ